MELDELAVGVIAKELAKAIPAYLEKANMSIAIIDTGTISEVLGNQIYKVKVEGTVYTVPSAVSDTYSVKQKVLVMQPLNNRRKKYIIGRAV
ncbi:MAG: hypothetical protein RR365_00955 [Bacteroides sp.]